MSKTPEPPFKVGQEVVNKRNDSKGIVESFYYDPGVKSFKYRILIQFAAAGKVKVGDTEWLKVDNPYPSKFEVSEWDLDSPGNYSKS